MPQELLDEWEAFYTLQPWGGADADFRLAYTLANLVQAQTGGRLKKPPKRDPNREPWTIADFLIDRQPRRAAERPRRKQSAEQPMTPDETAVYLAQIMGVPLSALAGADQRPLMTPSQ